jgi:Putative Actinobacterial Holin-X, holin superfamily III
VALNIAGVSLRLAEVAAGLVFRHSDDYPMKKSIESPVETDLTPLLSEIVADSQKLISQQIELLRLELLGELQKAKNAAFSLGAGLGLVAAGGLLSTQMLVRLLHRSTRLPLWACYGVVAGLLGAAGAKLIHSGGKEIDDLHLLPPPQTAEALKENLRWLKRQTRTE